jgi:hypothetical protein
VTGNVNEDGAGRLYTDDVFYHDHWWGPLYGKEEVKIWMRVDGRRRRSTPCSTGTRSTTASSALHAEPCDNLDPVGNPACPGLSTLWYAGDGLWSAEEDFWDLNGARRTAKLYAEACAKTGITDPAQRMTRKHWPASPEWARSDSLPEPSWLDGDVPGVTRPSELAALLAPLREQRRR